MISSDAIIQEIQNLYCSDSIPWIVNYSGGKDSTASLQLIWNAVAGLPAAQRTKEIHVISVDTLVENPLIASWKTSSLANMQEEAIRQGLPIKSHRLIPTLDNRFWVNLIGKGYPAPRDGFRWCTDRLKISAATRFIQDLSEKHREAILVLGSRRNERVTQGRIMDSYTSSTRERLDLTKHLDLPNVWLYLPIETWISDDVRTYLLTGPNPWGVDNRVLLGASTGKPGAEYPVVIGTSTPSCGDSRFGCYVCTMVSQNESMAAMVSDEDQKTWMQPILDFRNSYLGIDDSEVRELQPMHGPTSFIGGRNPKLIHGPYMQHHRARLLEELLKTQRIIRNAKVPGYDLVELISIEELDAIRQIWVEEKGEIEDLVPEIYTKVFDKPYPGKSIESLKQL